MGVCVATARTGRIRDAVASSPRVVIATDASEAGSVPEQVRVAADMISTCDLNIFQSEAVDFGAADSGVDGVIAWVEGDQLLQGASEDLRGVFLSRTPAATLVPVHLPCLPEADLVGLQPRLIRTGPAARQIVSRSIRIAGTEKPSELALRAWEGSRQPWAELYLALLCERRPGAGVEPLKRIWRQGKHPPFFAALVLRNLIVVLLRKGQLDKAEELLTLGSEAYPAYAELYYLAGVLWHYRQKPSKAVSHLDQATRLTEGEFVGGGGETSYRSQWLLGAIFEAMGDQNRAISRFLPGACRRPAFVPSVAGILRQRFSRSRAEQLHLPLCELARQEPSYLEAVFDFFIRHRVLGPPRRLLRTLPLPGDIHEMLQARLASAEERLRPATREAAEKPGVVLEGPFLALSGHSRINHVLGCSLLDSGDLDAALEPSESGSPASRLLPDRETIERGLRRQPNRVDLTIRHQWPPDFRPAETGRLACIVPWEHRAVPSAWVDEIERSVDELWVPSRFVGDSFIRGGVSSDRVRVIPNGFAPDIFHPGVASWRPQGCRGRVFLFVGGTIRRKGADLLLQAYMDAFSCDDDVTLIFKDTGASSFYLHNNLLSQVRKLARRPDSPHILVLTDEIDDRALASLYRGCDALVLPYRGEGFGIPLVEAMACARPVVTTAAGPALEFCSPDGAYLIPAVEEPVPDQPPPFGVFTSEWTWFEPNLIQLAEALRSIYEHPEDAARRGQIAAKRIVRTHAWPRIARLYHERIAHLTGLPAKESVQPAPELKPEEF